METHSLLWFPLKFHEPGPTRTNVGPGDEARGTRHLQLIIVITKPLVCLAFELLLTEILHTIQLPGVTRSVSSCLPTNSLQLYRGGGGGGGGGRTLSACMHGAYTMLNKSNPCRFIPGTYASYTHYQACLLEGIVSGGQGSS